MINDHDDVHDDDFIYPKKSLNTDTKIATASMQLRVTQTTPQIMQTVCDVVSHVGAQPRSQELQKQFP